MALATTLEPRVMVAPISPGRRRFYWFIGAMTILWVATLIAIALALQHLRYLFPDGYFYSYFVVDYSQGFVRRGLAGELAGLVPASDAFTAFRLLRWLPTVLMAGTLVILAWTVATHWGRSERRLMMALLVPFLPFGVAFAIFQATPPLAGAAALICACLALIRVKTASAVFVVSGVYGSVMAVLVLIHEATPLLFGLGVLAALSVLARQLSNRSFWLASALSLAPGLFVATLVALLGRRGVSARLCERIPHGPANEPMAANPPPTLPQLLHGFRYDVDYHDWACRVFLPGFDQSFRDGVRFVAGIGPLALTASTIYGLTLLAVTLLCLSKVSGVRVNRFFQALRCRPPAIALGLAMMIPIFATGADWIRWWVFITFDLAIVFMLFAAAEPESAQPPTRSALRTFAAYTAVFILPLGIIPAIGTPPPV